MKISITCKGVDDFSIETARLDSHIPVMGDIGIFRVLDIGKHDSIQGVNGNNCYLFEGDTFMAAFGNRYATEQFEGYVPDEPTKIFDILGKGGVVGVLKSMHYKFKDIGTTKVELIGYAVNKKGRVINSIYHNKKRVAYDSVAAKKREIILSLGCSMDSGKTTTAAYLARSLKLKGKKVGFIKLTGTYYTKDSHFVRDCGADISIDFGRAGYPSTFLLNQTELLDLYQYLLNIVDAENPDYIIVEIADGLFQKETEALLADEMFTRSIGNIIFSAVDSLSAIQGYNQLASLNLPPFALAGLFTASPLLHQEVEQRVSVPIFNLETILDLDLRLLERAKAKDDKPKKILMAKKVATAAKSPKRSKKAVREKNVLKS